MGPVNERDKCFMILAFKNRRYSECIKKAVGAVLTKDGKYLTESFNIFPNRNHSCQKNCLGLDPIYQHEKEIKLQEDVSNKKPLSPELRAALNSLVNGESTNNSILFLREDITEGVANELLALGIKRIYLNKDFLKYIDNEEINKLISNGIKVAYYPVMDLWADVNKWMPDTNTNETKYSAVLEVDNEVVGRAKKISSYNFFNGGYFRNYSSCETVCAERMAIYNQGKINPKKLKNSTIYTTHEPCYFCALVIVYVGVKRVIYSISSMKNHYGLEYLRKNGIAVDHIDSYELKLPPSCRSVSYA